MLRPDIAELTEQIKSTFKEWDRDGNGSISREELQAVIWKLGPFTSEDVGILLAEADVDGNGDIDYDEFVNFITRPASKVQISSDKAAFCDLEQVFRPLFDVYDRDKSGKITKAEFHECHRIVIKAVEDLPEAWLTKDSSSKHITRVVGKKKGEDELLFDCVDKDGSGSLSLAEFARWQRDSIKECGLTGEHLEEFIKTLAETMNKILNSRTTASGRMAANRDEDNMKALYRSLEICAKTFWKGAGCPKSWIEFRAGSRVGYKNVWEDPPPTMSVEKLVRMHMECVPVSTITCKELIVAVELIVPEIQEGEEDASDDEEHQGEQEGEEENEEAREKEETKEGEDEDEDVKERLWRAKVVQTHVLHCLPGKSPVCNSKSYYYVYSGDRAEWTRAENADFHLFDEAVENLAPELRVLALLYKEANYQQNLSWGAVRKALADAMDMDLLSPDAYKLYDNQISEVFHKTMVDELMLDDEESLCPVCFEEYWGKFSYHIATDKTHRKRVRELAFDLDLRVLDVMSDLTELGAVRLCSDLTIDKVGKKSITHRRLSRKRLSDKSKSSRRRSSSKESSKQT